MRFTWKIRRKCFRTKLFLFVTLLVVVVTWSYCLYRLKPRPVPSKIPPVAYNSFMTIEDVKYPEMKQQIASRYATTRTGGVSNPSPNHRSCTMETCFDVTNCIRQFKVYVYPPNPNEKPSPMYKKFLKIIRQSSYMTEDPSEACLKVLNLDTLDRDALSRDYVHRLPDKLKKQPYWNNGRNHLLFNFFSGSFPDYSDEIDFPYGQAMLAKSSFSYKWYRPGFDVSLPLLPKKHREIGKIKGDLNVMGNLFPARRRYLLVFKGKRYLWGLGSETRNALHHLNNDNDIIMLTTCKHGKHWDKHKDYRCLKDNALYDKYEYNHLITNSTFCLVPRGRRLGSFRFLESLKAACIPVSLSNGFILPFQEIIDWSKAAFTFDERQLLQLPQILRNIPNDTILSMRLQTQLYWEEYLSSIQRVVMTTLEIIKNRIQQSSSHFIWTHFPGGLVADPVYSHKLSDYPFYSSLEFSQSVNYTAIILATRPAPMGNSSLVRLLKNLCSNLPHLSKILVMWIGNGKPKIMQPSYCSVKIYIHNKQHKKQYLTKVMFPIDEITTPAILTLWEDTELIGDEAEFAYLTWLSNRDRLIGFTSQRHYWSPAQKSWKYSVSPSNKYSMISLGASIYHKYYGYYMLTKASKLLRAIADNSRDCFDVAINFLISDLVGKSPLKLSQRLKLSNHHKPESSTKSYSSCLNFLVPAFGYMPLQYSLVRADPVLFKDKVSAQRKLFRRLENIE